MWSSWPRGRYRPKPPSKLRIMQRIDTSSSSSPEVNDSHFYQQSISHRSSAQSQSRLADIDIGGSGSTFAAETQHSSLNDPKINEGGSDRDSEYDGGDESEDLETALGYEGPLSSEGRPRGRAKSESDGGSGGRFVDADGEIDLDAIQTEELRGLGIETGTSNSLIDIPGAREVAAAAQSSSRRKRAEEEEGSGRDGRKTKIAKLGDEVG